jgi:hypothetical protein
MLDGREAHIMSDIEKIVAAILTVAKFSQESSHSTEGCVTAYHEMLAALD